MGVDDKIQRKSIFAFFIVLYISFAIYSFLHTSQWIFDNFVAIAFTIFIFCIYRWAMLSWRTFLLFNMALTLHNLGTFGLYNLGQGFFAYDAIVHLFGSMVTAYIIFNLVSQKLHFRGRKRVRKTVIDEHRVMLVFLVIASVAMLATFIELVEFGGFVFLGPGEGMFFTGSGDGGYTTDDFKAQYFDTMQDIIVNTIGSFIGVLIFYMVRYRSRYGIVFPDGKL